MIDPRLLVDVQKAEGCKLAPYLDTQGYWTIGYGHELGRGPPPLITWTQDQANAQLQMDLELAQSYAQGLSEWPYLDTACRQNAVTELYFNMGARWLGFTFTRGAIRAQNWQGAHDQLLDSLWASQVGPNRSSRLANYLLTGEYPS